MNFRHFFNSGNDGESIREAPAASHREFGQVEGVGTGQKSADFSQHFDDFTAGCAIVTLLLRLLWLAPAFLGPCLCAANASANDLEHVVEPLAYLP